MIFKYNVKQIPIFCISYSLCKRFYYNTRLKHFCMHIKIMLIFKHEYALDEGEIEKINMKIVYYFSEKILSPMKYNTNW